MQKPILSICIPTYNRADFILKGLNFWKTIPSVRDVEIVIVDDGSSDNTQKLVREFVKNNPELYVVYHKFSEHIGFDKMMLSIVKYAHGKYCWLISDDDLPHKKSIKKLFSIMKKYPETALIHMNYSRFDNKLQKITAKRMVGEIYRDIIFNNPNDFYFKEIRDSYFPYLGTNVITMSTDVVNREQWLIASKGLENFIGHNFMHCFIISKMIMENPKIYYIANPNVQYLSNNHRIWPNDIWKDYNEVFLNFMKKIGYDKSKLNKMQRHQNKFEKRENMMKHPVLKFVYKFVHPIYAFVGYLKTKNSKM